MPLLAPQPSSASALKDARARGRQIGSRASGLGIDCPYLFDIIDLRHQWFAGFSEGRAVLRQVLQAD